MAPVVPGSWTAADWVVASAVVAWVVAASLEAAVDAESEAAGSEGAVVVVSGVVVVTAGALVGGTTGADVVVAAAVTGGTTTRLRHWPWLPEVSIAETWIETLVVRWGHETVALVSAVWTDVKPSPFTTYNFTATLSWPASHASEIVDSLLAISLRPVTGDGGRVSGVALLTVVGGADQTGIFAVEDFADGVAAAVREMPASATWGTPTIPLSALGTAITVAPIPSAAIKSTCQ
jgi:hypothetical protein